MLKSRLSVFYLSFFTMAPMLTKKILIHSYEKSEIILQAGSSKISEKCSMKTSVVHLV